MSYNNTPAKVSDDDYFCFDVNLIHTNKPCIYGYIQASIFPKAGIYIAYLTSTMDNSRNNKLTKNMFDGKVFYTVDGCEMQSPKFDTSGYKMNPGSTSIFSQIGGAERIATVGESARGKHVLMPRRADPTNANSPILLDTEVNVNAGKVENGDQHQLMLKVSITDEQLQQTQFDKFRFALWTAKAITMSGRSIEPNAIIPIKLTKGGKFYFMGKVEKHVPQMGSSNSSYSPKLQQQQGQMSEVVKSSANYSSTSYQQPQQQQQQQQQPQQQPWQQQSKPQSSENPYNTAENHSNPTPQYANPNNNPQQQGNTAHYQENTEYHPTNQNGGQNRSPVNNPAPQNVQHQQQPYNQNDDKIDDSLFYDKSDTDKTWKNQF